MNNKTKVAIVILNWNGEKLFQQFLPSILEHSKTSEISIIVADNGSTDNSLKILKEDFPEIQILDLKNNYGFAVGYNMALAQIQADYFVLLNSDVKVSANWITPCIDRMDKDPSIAAVQPKIRSSEEPESFEYAGAAGGFIDKYGYPFCRGRILNHLEKDEGQYNHSTDIFWASGAAMFVRASAFKEAGGLDGDFWAHMEEIDLCWRLKGMGYRIVYEPQSVVYHLGGGTLSYDSPQKIYLNFRNNLWMLYKNVPPGKFIGVITIRLILDGIAAVKFLLGSHINGFKAVWKAHIAFYRNQGSLRKKRRMIQEKVSIHDHKEILPKSVMWNFFILKKHTFTELDFNP